MLTTPPVSGSGPSAPDPASPDPGTVIRVARSALGWSQVDLGQRCGYSASQVSRWETGRQPVRDVELLRKLADVLHLAPDVFGLADMGASTRLASGSGHRVGRVTIPMREEDDPVRRRAFLLTAGSVVAASATGAWPIPANARPGALDPAALLAQQLGD